MGILKIWTTPVAGDIFVDGQWMGNNVWQGELPVGVYTVSFGNVAGMFTPDDVEASVQCNETTHIEGIYGITFIKTLGEYSHHMSGYSVQQTTDGGYIVVGDSIYYDTDVYLLKTDYKGDKLWSRGIDGSYWDVGRSVQQTSDGGYILVGGKDCHTSGELFFYCNEVLLVKTDNNGNELWSRSFDYGIGHRAREQGRCQSVQQTSDGGYIISTGSRGYVIKTDSNGNELWSKNFGYVDDVRQTSDGGYIMAGYKIQNQYDVHLIKTDANGNEQWTKTFGESATNEKGYSVQQTYDGGYVIAGYTISYVEFTVSVYLIKTDNIGNEIWSRTYSEGDSDYGYSVCQTNDGGVCYYRNVFRAPCSPLKNR